VGRAVFLFAFLTTLLFGSIPGRAQCHGTSELESNKPIDANGNEAMSNNSSRDLSASPPDLFFSEGKRTSVILDGWWSRGYAQASCEAESADASEIGHVFQRDRCAEFNPATATLDFEDKLMNHLRTDARCQSLIVARYNGPMETSIELYRLMAAPHWSLTLDFRPAAPLQTWSLSNEVGTYSRGESESLERMASDICNTIMRADQSRRGRTQLDGECAFRAPLSLNVRVTLHSEPALS